MAEMSSNAVAVLQDLKEVMENSRLQARPAIWDKIAAKNTADDPYLKRPYWSALSFPAKTQDSQADAAKGVDAKYTITTTANSYKGELKLHRNLVNDTRSNVLNLANLGQEMVSKCSQLIDKTFSEWVENGATSGYEAYDGTAYYSATGHYYAGSGSNLIDNVVSGSGTDVVSLRDDLNSALAKMRRWKDNEGGLLNPGLQQDASNLVVHCPPELAVKFATVLNTSWSPIGANSSGTPMASENVLRGLATLVVDGYLTGTGSWYLHYTGDTMRPFEIWEREPPKIDVLGMDSEQCIKTGYCSIITWQRFAIIPQAFYRSVKIVNT